VSTWAGVPGQSGVALLPNGDLAISDENAVLVVR
jgi:hypothetical protein